MAKIRLNAAFEQMKGTLGGMVLRQTPHGPILARSPDMSRVKWSPAQRAQRRRMKAAAAHYRSVMADPAAADRLRTRAKKLGMPVSSLVMGEFLQRGKT